MQAVVGNVLSKFRTFALLLKPQGGDHGGQRLFSQQLGSHMMLLPPSSAPKPLSHSPAPETCTFSKARYFQGPLCTRGLNGLSHCPLTDATLLRALRGSPADTALQR